jgi:tetratricopeptide (TPR) repeat protein
MFRSIVLLVGGLASLSTTLLLAQDASLGQKFGQGVHDYFSGDFVGAYEQLTSAINAGSKDPRVFYFRGLAYLELGRKQEASMDFRKGAQLEATDTNKFYNVSKALERVQGPGRAALESYRVDARMVVMEHAEKLRKARYEALQREESRVLRVQPLTPPEPIETPKATKATVEPAAKPEKPETAVVAPQAPAKPASEKKSSLLGAVGKALGKAVAGESDKPAAEKKPAEAEKPFGEAPAAEEKPAAKEKPAKEDANPDDPFAK